MIGQIAAAGTWSADGLAGASVAAAVGGLLGWMLMAWCGRLLAADAGDVAGAAAAGGDAAASTGGKKGSASGGRWVIAVAILVALGLWWWEVRMAGGAPSSVVRAAARLALLFLLAAASWIDLRERVIPDAITVPGVLLGLACVWAWPDVLLPIAREVPRSFALPQLEPDVLGLCGGLRSGDCPGWLGPWPQPGGLLAAVGVFATWWLACTVPFSTAAGWRHVAREPRNLILVGGVAAIGLAWGAGGERFIALQTALAGMAVSGGIVWAVRAAASRAVGREAMGFGDVTLMTMVGAWTGWQACVLAFFIAAFIGLAHGVFQLVAHRERELPYGPSLCIASTLVVVGWRWLWPVVGRHFAEPLELGLVVGAVVVLTGVTLAVWKRVRGSVG